MSTSTGTTSSARVYTTPAFWERLWRTAGIQSMFCFIVAYIDARVYGGIRFRYDLEAGARQGLIPVDG